MSPSQPFILRPVATTLLMIAIMLSGMLAFRFLPVAALPEVDYPTIQVQTFYPGASPDVMTSSVTAPLEVQFGQMPNLNQMSSVSSAGASVITLQFGLDAFPSMLPNRRCRPPSMPPATCLPSDLPAPPIYAKVNPADAPILTLGLTSKTMPLTQVEDFVDTRLAQKISQLPGVGLVSISGGQRPAVRIRADIRKLAAYGLNIDDLRTTLGNANINTPKGNFDGAMRAYTINANDQIRNASDYKSLIVAYKNGSPVRLSDVGDVIDGAQNDKLGAWMNETPAIILNIQRQPGANVISVVEGIKALLPQLQASLPAAIDLNILTDRTVTIRASVQDVEYELTLAVILVVLVIFVFLRNARATLIPSLSVPLSLVGTLGAMYLFGFSLNNLSLMALTIATGFVVDDAIVVIENISRYLEEGDTPLQAALRGSEQIGFTIISLTVSLIAVLIPLLFMGDVVGRLFREFAITLSVTILISAVVSLTLVPMACAKLLKAETETHENAFQRYSREGFDRIIAVYGRALNWVLDRQTFVLFIALGTFALTALLYVVIPKGFFPLQDTGVIQAISEAPQSVSYAAMAERQQQLASAILKDPDVDSLSSFIGVDGTNTTLNSGRILINLKSHDQRKSDIATVMQRIKNSTASLTGITLYMQPVQDLTIEGTVSRTQYQFILQDADPAQLAEWTPKLVDKLNQLPQLGRRGQRYLEPGSFGLRSNRPRSSRPFRHYAGDDRQCAVRLLRPAHRLHHLHQLQPVPRYPRSRPKPADLAAIIVGHLSAVVGRWSPVPLAVMAKMREETAPLQVSHLGQFPASTVSFNLAPGASLGEAVTAIKQAQVDIGLPLSVISSFQGAALAFQSSLSNQLFLILAAIVTVYIVLGVLYESFIHPLTILSTLPSAGIGALLALMAAGDDLTIVAIIGIILLIGIVKKNAIMMIDFALDAERNEGKPPREAIYQACLLRFRPILMTTMAAVLGALPLMLGTGAGSELRHPLGISIVGGLLVSQLLTLFTTPVIYLWFDRLATRFAGPPAKPARRTN